MGHDWRMSSVSPDPILPPATIGILGGGQLGRMLGFAARAMGYGIRVLDPDPACPAAAIADHVEVGSYDDIDGRAPHGATAAPSSPTSWSTSTRRSWRPSRPGRPGAPRRSRLCA